MLLVGGHRAFGGVLELLGGAIELTMPQVKAGEFAISSGQVR